MLDEVVWQSSVRELAFRDEDLARVNRNLRCASAGNLNRSASGQKTLYTRLLGESLVMWYLDHLHDLSDDAARKFLLARKGIGVWTADIHLLSALRRPDIWPASDLALAVAFRKRKVCVRVLHLNAAKNSATCGVRIEPQPRAFSGIPTLQNVAKTALPSVCSSP
jgi:hypothetical protein